MTAPRTSTRPAPGRRVVFHADDLGFNRCVTDGILHGFGEGLLTSSSLLANAPDATRALQRWQVLQRDAQAGSLPSTGWRQRLGDPPRPFDLGIHLNLTQGRPLTGEQYPSVLLDEQGRFPGVFRLFVNLWRYGARVRLAVREELRHQLKLVRDHGLQPTHVNGHQYAEMLPLVAELVPDLLQEFGIRVVRVAEERGLSRSTLQGVPALQLWVLGQIKRAYGRRLRQRLQGLPIVYPDAYFGSVHAGHIDLRLVQVFLANPAAWQLAEINLHPALAAEAALGDVTADGWHDPLAAWRPRELSLLKSTELAQYLESQAIRLGRLSDLGEPRS